MDLIRKIGRMICNSETLLENEEKLIPREFKRMASTGEGTQLMCNTMNIISRSIK